MTDHDCTAPQDADDQKLSLQNAMITEREILTEATKELDVLQGNTMVSHLKAAFAVHSCMSTIWFGQRYHLFGGG